MAISWRMVPVSAIYRGIATSGFALLAMTWKLEISLFAMHGVVIDGWSAWAVPHALQEETAAVLVKIIIHY